MTSEGFKNGIGNHWGRGCKLAPRDHSAPDGQTHTPRQSSQTTHPSVSVPRKERQFSFHCFAFFIFTEDCLQEKQETSLMAADC